MLLGCVWFVVVVIRLVCAALAVDPFVQYGGAIYATSSTVTMTSCTLSGNTADVRTPATWMHDWLEWLMIVDVVSDDGYNARVVMMAGLLTD